MKKDKKDIIELIAVAIVGLIAISNMIAMKRATEIGWILKFGFEYIATILIMLHLVTVFSK